MFLDAPVISRMRGFVVLGILLRNLGVDLLCGQRWYDTLRHYLALGGMGLALGGVGPALFLGLRIHAWKRALFTSSLILYNSQPCCSALVIAWHNFSARSTGLKEVWGIMS